MKHTLLASLTLVIALSACAIAPSTSDSAVSPSAAASAPAPSDQIVRALLDVALAKQASTALAQAGKMTWAQDDQAQAALNAIAVQLESAQTLLPTNAAQAAQMIASALSALAVYQSQGSK